MMVRRWWRGVRDELPGRVRSRPSATTRGRAVVSAAGVALVIVVTSTADVLATGPLRRWDQHLMPGLEGLRVTGWAHVLWRAVVVGGQFWLVGSLVAIAAVVAAWRRRDLLLAEAVGGWLAVTNAVVWLFKQALGRTAPGSGGDLLFAAGQSFPFGHAALGAACLLVSAALVRGGRGRFLAGAGGSRLRHGH